VSFRVMGRGARDAAGRNAEERPGGRGVGSGGLLRSSETFTLSSPGRVGCGEKLTWTRRRRDGIINRAGGRRGGENGGTIPHSGARPCHSSADREDPRPCPREMDTKEILIRSKTDHGALFKRERGGGWRKHASDATA